MTEHGRSASSAAPFESAVRAYHDGNRPRAAQLAKLVIARQPQHAGALFLLGACALDDNNAGDALPYLEAAARLDPGNFSILRALGMAHLGLRHWEAAAQNLQRALSSRSDDAGILNALGIALSELGCTDKALHSYRKAARLDPGNSEIYNNMAITLDQLRDGSAAINACREAVHADPANVPAWANMAALLEQANRLDEAEAAAKEGLARDPQHAHLIVTAALCTARRGNSEHAIASLEQLLKREISPRLRRTAEFELGRMYDRLDNTETAFRHFQRANELTLEVMPESAGAADKFRSELERLSECFTATRIKHWFPQSRNPPVEGMPRTAFLVGFPRSGTTLLDTFLGSHPEVTVLEEEPCLEQALNQLRKLRPAYPDALERLDPAAWDALRTVYWRAVVEHSPHARPAGLLLDKNPFMSAHAGFIHALLPRARFVFALRHPCDVVLSCFMQSFTGTPVAGSFLTLEKIAETYGRIMDLWFRYREICDLEVHELRYESLVTDTPGTLPGVFEFLGLDWQPALRDHTTHARKRGRIYTPSYSQVTAPLSTKSINRWQRYADRFGPVLEKLRPYVERFGYTL